MQFGIIYYTEKMKNYFFEQVVITNKVQKFGLFSDHFLTWKLARGIKSSNLGRSAPFTVSSTSQIPAKQIINEKRLKEI